MERIKVLKYWIAQRVHSIFVLLNIEMGWMGSQGCLLSPPKYYLRSSILAQYLLGFFYFVVVSVDCSVDRPISVFFPCVDHDRVGNRIVCSSCRGIAGPHWEYRYTQGNEPELSLVGKRSYSLASSSSIMARCLHGQLYGFVRNLYEICTDLYGFRDFRFVRFYVYLYRSVKTYKSWSCSEDQTILDQYLSCH